MNNLLRRSSFPQEKQNTPIAISTGHISLHDFNNPNNTGDMVVVVPGFKHA